MNDYQSVMDPASMEPSMLEQLFSSPAVGTAMQAAGTLGRGPLGLLSGMVGTMGDAEAARINLGQLFKSGNEMVNSRQPWLAQGLSRNNPTATFADYMRRLEGAGLEDSALVRNILERAAKYGRNPMTGQDLASSRVQLGRKPGSNLPIDVDPRAGVTYIDEDFISRLNPKFQDASLGAGIENAASQILNYGR